MLILTRTMIQTIFTSSYFPRLSVLNLGWTNIDDRSLSFLEGTSISTALKELSLSKKLDTQSNASSARKDFDTSPIYSSLA